MTWNMNVHCENKCERVIEQQRHHLVSRKKPRSLPHFSCKLYRQMQKNERQIMWSHNHFPQGATKQCLWRAEKYSQQPENSLTHFPFLGMVATERDFWTGLSLRFIMCCDDANMIGSTMLVRVEPEQCPASTSFRILADLGRFGPELWRCSFIEIL